MQVRVCVAWYVLALLGLATAQQLQCPTDSVTEVNGELMFGPLSEGSGPVDATYDPGTIGAWNALANGFVDTVRSGDLPYDILIPVINSTFIVNSGQSVDLLGLLNTLASWWAGILAVTLIGIIIGILFLVVGGCFWCCRCCGKCGGAKSQDARENNDCLTFTFAAILLLCSLVLFAAAVLAFFSNEQTFRSVDNLQTTLNSVVQDSSDYIRDTTQEVNDIVCQGVTEGGVIGLVQDEITGIQESLVSTIDQISTELTTLVNQLNNSVLSNVNTVLDEVMTSVDNVTVSVERIRTELTTARDDLNTAITNCMNAGLGANCDPIVAVRDAITTSLGQIPNVPDISSQLSELENAISGIGGNIRDGQNELMNVLGPQVMEQINSSLQQVEPFIDQARSSLSLITTQLSTIVDPIINTTFPDSECPSLESAEVFSRIYIPPFDFATLFSPDGGSVSPLPPTPEGQFLLSLGYINECVINSAFNYVRSFDVYRYAVGIVICCLALITIVLVWVGLLLGMIGFRKDRYPYDRSNVSHCGGICLLISVGLTFLFGFFLLLLSSIFFFLGSNAFKMCQAIQGPNYPAFANTIDEPSIRAAFAQGNPIIDNLPSISGLLRGCEENNTALFTAANINQILTSLVPDYAGSLEGTLNQAFNLTSLRATVDSTISQVAEGLNLNQSTITDAIETALNSLQNTTFDVNITNYIADLDSSIAAADLNNSIESLRNASTMLTMAGQASQATTLDNTADTLVLIRDVLIVELRIQLNGLQETLDRVTVAAEDLQQNITSVATDLGTVIANVSGPVVDTFINQTVRGAVDQSFDFILSYIQHVDTQVMDNVAGCQPVYGVYTNMHNTVCRNFLDGLNGFWWSLGFCAILFIPVIIFAVITSNFFLKKKSIDGDLNLDYQMKAY